MTSLKGKKILVTIQELELKEHRGIASFTKSLIIALNKAEAEIWLLVGMDFKKLEFKTYNKKIQNRVLSAFISDYLIKGIDIKLIPKATFTEKIKYILSIFRLIIFSRSYGNFNSLKLRFFEKDDNPYLRFERTSYLKNVEGFYVAPHIYANCKFSSFLPFGNQIKIDIQNFDALITSAPLNLSLNEKSKKNKIFIQTIHDLIPIEYEPKKFIINSFLNMLRNCKDSNNIFVSEVTRNKFESNMISKLSTKNNLKKNISNTVIIQPPTLFFEEFDDQFVYKNILNSINKSQNKKKLVIKPFKYFLFNSSIDSRKNVFLLINAFQNSDLQKNGFTLVITGKLKNDKYSLKLKKIIDNNPGIILTDYISETLKSTLYLNALCLLSPSIIEGFGIPVLDACCLGLPCYASDCFSHKEIYNLFDFSNYLDLYSPDSEIQWTNVFFKQRYIKILDEEEKRSNRIRRYKDMSSKILEDFSNQISRFYSGL